MTRITDASAAGPPNGVVFVCGSMRSGTTLLQKVLCTAPEAHPFINGCRYLTDHLRIQARYAGPERPYVDDYFGSVENLHHFTRAIVEAFLHETWQTNGRPQTLILKSPEISFFVPTLARMLAATRFVFSVREPKDAIASMITVGERLIASGIDAPLSHAGRNIEILCRMFTNHYSPALAEIDTAGSPLAGRLLLIRYEDLIRRTDETVARLAEYCRIAPSPPAGDGGNWRSSASTGAIAHHPKWRLYLTELYGRPISDESIGRYRSVLSDAEAAEVDARCAAFRTRFGYR